VTFADRAAAVEQLGFTERQSRFLVTVMLHSGVCMLRQYCAFAGIVCGQNVREFFGRLVSRRFATAYRCAHGRGRLFHLHHRGLYDAIGEPDNRFRRPTPLPRAVERLMLLDAVLAGDKITWLATEREKVAHFTVLLHGRLDREELPHLVFGTDTSKTIRYFPDKLPIGVHNESRAHVFTYLANRSTPVDFRPFLRRHADLFRALPRWTVRLLVPTHLTKAAKLYESAWREELASPLRLSTADELRWYFDERRRRENGSVTTKSDSAPRFMRARDAFGAARYRVLYRSWIQSGPAALAGLASPVLADAISRGTGQLETVVLSHRYLHLAPLVTTA
jgi:hypothetical protein